MLCLTPKLTCRAVQHIHGSQPRTPTLRNPVSTSRAPHSPPTPLPTALPAHNRSQAAQRRDEPPAQRALPADSSHIPQSKIDGFTYYFGAQRQQEFSSLSHLRKQSRAVAGLWGPHSPCCFAASSLVVALLLDGPEACCLYATKTAILSKPANSTAECGIAGSEEADIAAWIAMHRPRIHRDIAGRPEQQIFVQEVPVQQYP